MLLMEYSFQNHNIQKYPPINERGVVSNLFEMAPFLFFEEYSFSESYSVV